MVVMTRRQRRRMAEATESPITILPQEMMLEIFSRVELSDTLQLRGVCKLWKSLAIDPQFVCNHFSRACDEIADLDSKAKKHLSEEEDEEDKEEVVATTGDEGEVDEAKKCLMKSLADLDIDLEETRILKEKVEKINFDVQPLDDRLKSIKSCICDWQHLEGKLKCVKSFLRINLNPPLWVLLFKKRYHK